MICLFLLKARMLLSQTTSKKNLLLRNSKLNIFWSEVTLCEIGNSDFSKFIEEAISSSKNMCVVGTDIENILSNWVQYEWRLFKHCQLNDKSNFYNNLFLAVCDIDPMNLPLPLQLCECLVYCIVEN